MKKCLILIVLLLILTTSCSKEVKEDNLISKENVTGAELLIQATSLNNGVSITEDMMMSTIDILKTSFKNNGVEYTSIQIPDRAKNSTKIKIGLSKKSDVGIARSICLERKDITLRDANDHVKIKSSDLKPGSTKMKLDNKSQPIIELNFKDSKKFGTVTKQISEILPPNNVLVVWLDFENGIDNYLQEAKKNQPKYITAPTVRSPINSEIAFITGNFNETECKQIVNKINAGTLPVKLELIDKLD